MPSTIPLDTIVLVELNDIWPMHSCKCWRDMQAADGRVVAATSMVVATLYKPFTSGMRATRTLDGSGDQISQKPLIIQTENSA